MTDRRHQELFREWVATQNPETLRQLDALAARTNPDPSIGADDLRTLEQVRHACLARAQAARTQAYYNVGERSHIPVLVMDIGIAIYAKVVASNFTEFGCTLNELVEATAYSTSTVRQALDFMFAQRPADNAKRTGHDVLRRWKVGRTFHYGPVLRDKTPFETRAYNHAAFSGYMNDYVLPISLTDRRRFTPTKMRARVHVSAIKFDQAKARLRAMRAEGFPARAVRMIVTADDADLFCAPC